MTTARLSEQFFHQPTHLLARSLLGKIVVLGETSGRIVEVEAYQGPADPGAHSFGGRRTRRTEVMFGPPGHAYVYLIYGMYECLNVVSGEEGSPEAVLIRALAPEAGLDIMVQRRTRIGKQPVPFGRLTNGPGRLTKALAITRRLNGSALWRPPLYLLDDGYQLPPGGMAQGPRIGFGYAARLAAAFPWRYWIQGNPFVSS